MYHCIEDFTTDWKYESEATLKLFRVLTDSSLGQKVTPDGRSLGFLAWHIVLTLGEMGQRMGMRVECPHEDAPEPRASAEIAALFETAARSVENDVRDRWTDGSFPEMIDMYGEKWSRGQALTSMVKHQIHHRAQMTVLMRQAGLKVPGIYGPSREEWSQFGMAPQK
jgi:uncharacterized damage-inducible protein DinB